MAKSDITGKRKLEAPECLALEHQDEALAERQHPDAPRLGPRGRALRDAEPDDARHPHDRQDRRRRLREAVRRLARLSLAACGSSRSTRARARAIRFASRSSDEGFASIWGLRLRGTRPTRARVGAAATVARHYGASPLDFIRREAQAMPVAQSRPALDPRAAGQAARLCSGATPRAPFRIRASARARSRGPPSMRDGYAFRQHVETARRNRGPDDPRVRQFPVFYFTEPPGGDRAGRRVVEELHLEQLDFELEVAVVIGREGRTSARRTPTGTFSG